MGRKILTTFLEQNPWSEVAEKDETTRKEVQIVSPLLERHAASCTHDRSSHSHAERHRSTNPPSPPET
jgi:hypothetical protein